MKRFVVLLLVLLLALSMTACGAGGPEETTAPPDAAGESADNEGAYEEADGDEYEGTHEDERPEIEEIPFAYVSELPVPEFTHTTDEIGFVLGEDWTMNPEPGESGIFIIGMDEENAALVTVVGPEVVDPAWPDTGARLYDMLEMIVRQTQPAEDLIIRALPAGELGHAVYRADYVMTGEDATYAGIGFIVTNGEQFLFIQGTLTGGNIIYGYFDFVSSIRFLD